MAQSAIDFSNLHPVNIDTGDRLIQLQQMGQQRQLLNQRLQLGNLAMQEQQRQLNGPKVYSDIVQRHMSVDAKGNVTTDDDAIDRDLRTAGYFDVADMHAKRASDLRAAHQKILDDRTSKIQNVVTNAALAPQGQQQQVVLAGLKELERQGTLEPGTADAMGNDPGIFSAFANQGELAKNRREEGKNAADIANLGAQAEEAGGKAEESRANAAKIRAETGALPQTVDDAQAKLDALFPPDSKDANVKDTNTRYSNLLKAGPYAPLLGQKVVDQAGREAESISVEKNKLPIKIEQLQAGAGNIGGGGLDLAAQAYLQNQTLPGRNALLNAKIMNRAAEIAKDHGMNAQAVVAARNAAAASKEALDDLTKKSANVEAFSQTAEKNMQVLEGAMKDVTDLGAPFLNTPIRTLQAKIGDAKVTAFSAAIVPVQTEIAKILNSTSATGMLTDTARSEMEHAISPGATPAQLKAALDIFRKDIHNRKDTYAAQLQDLQQKSVVGGSDAGPANAFIKPGGALDKLINH